VILFGHGESAEQSGAALVVELAAGL